MTRCLAQAEREAAAARLRAIEKVARRWAVPPVNAATALLDAAAAAASRKALLGDAERRLEQLEEEFDLQGRSMARLAAELSSQRATAVAAMEAAAHAALAQLGMGKSRFAVKLARTREAPEGQLEGPAVVRLAEGCYTTNTTGVDRVEFQLVRSEAQSPCGRATSKVSNVGPSARYCHLHRSAQGLARRRYIN